MTIRIKLERPRIEELFAPYRELIGKDYQGYRNHVYRTVTYAMHILDDSQDFEPLVETAMVYHDIGLWTHGELAYLEPSESVAMEDNEKFNWGLDSEVIQGIIHWHHKIFPYRGPHQKIIDACRRADWIDASQGWLRKGLARKDILETQKAFPNKGFHRTLLRLTKDLGGSTLRGSVKVTRGIVKW